MSDSPLTLDGTEWDDEAVADLVFTRVLMTDEEWSEEGEHEWEISREEAATRIADSDFSAPDFYQDADKE